MDPDELSEVINGFYGHGSEHSPDEVVYSRPGDTSYAIKLKYKDRKVISIETGPSFKAEEREQLSERIHAELLSQEQVIGRSILFSTYLIDGAYTAPSNCFQILPIPSHAPKPPHPGVMGLGGHPFLIEFPFADSPNTLIKRQRCKRTASELALFIHSILEGTITMTGEKLGESWVTIKNESDQKPTYQYCHEGYSYEGFEQYGSAFTSPQAYNPLRKVDANAYYGQRSQLPRSLTIPDIIDSIVSKYLLLAKDERDRFLRAAFWLYQSAGATSQSSSFLNLIFAIDTLVPPETNRTSCQSCKQSIGKSLTDRFVDFLADVVPEQVSDQGELRAARRKLGKLRGDLAHGRDLLASDRNASYFAFNPDGIASWRSKFYASALAKIALRNWLQR